MLRGVGEDKEARHGSEVLFCRRFCSEPPIALSVYSFQILYTNYVHGIRLYFSNPLFNMTRVHNIQLIYSISHHVNIYVLLRYWVRSTCPRSSGVQLSKYRCSTTTLHGCESIILRQAWNERLSTIQSDGGAVAIRKLSVSSLVAICECFKARIGYDKTATNARWFVRSIFMEINLYKDWTQCTIFNGMQQQGQMITTH